jgi:hypothetical protein
MGISAGAVLAGPSDHDMWKRYMSAPNDQANSLFRCPTQAPIQCIEGLCNFYYGTGKSEADLLPSSIGGSGGSPYSARITLENIMDYGVLALTPPDSPVSLCKIVGVGEIYVRDGSSAIVTQLKKTPVILIITGWSDIAAMTKDGDFSPILYQTKQTYP